MLYISEHRALGGDLLFISLEEGITGASGPGGLRQLDVVGADGWRGAEYVESEVLHKRARGALPAGGARQSIQIECGIREFHSGTSMSHIHTLSLTRRYTDTHT